MKLGLITDIHEHVEHLRTALGRFRSERVDQVVLIGDVCEMGERLEETCRLLAEAKTIGVWGNHDYGLCVEPDAQVRSKYSVDVIEFMMSLRPRLNVAGCHFTHVEPWLNPEELADLWYFDGMPDENGRLKQIFDAVPNRLMFVGHYHRWMLAASDAIDAWCGQSPISLAGGRFFIVVGALCEGKYAILDTESSMLVPFSEVSKQEATC